MPLACTAPPILPATKTTNGTRATSRAIEQQRRSYVRTSASAAAAAAAAASAAAAEDSGEAVAAPGGPSSSTVAAILLFVLILPAAPDPAAAAAHHNATTALSLLNPWLSACDIADPAAAPDLRGSCSARDAMPSLSDNNHYSNNYVSGVNKQRINNSSSNYGKDTAAEMTTGRLNGQVSEGPGPPCGGGGGADRECLCGGVRLDEAAAAAACAAAPGRREAALRRLRLRQCCGRAPLDALRPEARNAALRGPPAACRAHLRALARLDALAATLACKFDELLRRYDCAQDYSVSFGCAHCQEAYRQWVCATLVPAFVGGRRVRPCRSVCQRVEQRCPFFLPGDRAPNLPTQYAGEPTFLCLDTNIPETGEQRERSLFADEPAGECCFRPCAGGGVGVGGGVCLSAGCEGGSPRPAPAAHAAPCAPSAPAGPGPPPQQQAAPVFSACPAPTAAASTTAAAASAVAVRRRRSSCWTVLLLPVSLDRTAKTSFITLLLHIITILVEQTVFVFGYT